MIASIGGTFFIFRVEYSVSIINQFTVIAITLICLISTTSIRDTCCHLKALKYNFGLRIILFHQYVPHIPTYLPELPLPLFSLLLFLSEAELELPLLLLLLLLLLFFFQPNLRSAFLDSEPTPFSS